jgi:hypothetical protein
MRTLVAVLFAATLASIGLANAADGCGPGCHMGAQRRVRRRWLVYRRACAE